MKTEINKAGEHSCLSRQRKKLFKDKEWGYDKEEIRRWNEDNAPLKLQHYTVESAKIPYIGMKTNINKAVKICVYLDNINSYLKTKNEDMTKKKLNAGMKIMLH